MSEAICGDGADARYCPVFWAKSAECDELRTLARNILVFAIGTTVFDRTPEQQVLIEEWTAVLEPAITGTRQDTRIFTPFELADQAIGLFVEYRDTHGHDEASARSAAALEVADGAAVTDAELAGPDEDDEGGPF